MTPSMSAQCSQEDATLTHLGASAIARRIADGLLSSKEVVEAHIRRIEAVNPRLNAVVVPLFEQARAEAGRADDVRGRGTLLGPLHGVPITLKRAIYGHWNTNNSWSYELQIAADGAGRSAGKAASSGRSHCCSGKPTSPNC